MAQKGINWNDFPAYQKRGTCVIKENCKIAEWKSTVNDNTEKVYIHSRWIIDKDIPIFKGEGRNYIEKLVMVGE